MSSRSSRIEMLKSLYDFQAVYPKTISFEEGEYFILYQTSARQRNWWQVVSMKGNIGFVPSNYVTKIKVEHDFLIGFLSSSIESLEQSNETEINGIMSKEELLERLRDKKCSMEQAYLESSERDYDSSLSLSQSFSDRQRGRSKSVVQKQTAYDAPKAPNDRRQQQERTLARFSPPTMKRLEMTKKSVSNPAVSSGLVTQPIAESPSLGTIQVQTQHPQQQLQQQVIIAAQKANDVTQDNSVTSEPSETTTTTTTTSEDVVTTYKEPSQQDAAAAAAGDVLACHNENALCTQNITLSVSTTEIGSAEDHSSTSVLTKSAYDDNMAGGESNLGASDDNTAQADSSEHISYEKIAIDKSEASDVPSVENGCNDVESQALDSIEESGCSGAAAAVAASRGGSYNQPKLNVPSSDVYQIVDVIRRNTSLSFDMSCEALRVVLTSLEQIYNGAINPYLEAVAVHVTDRVATPKELLGLTHDAKRLQYIFSQLADCKNDTEQRSWMLYEDEEDIIQFLQELVEILTNADENICCFAISSEQYQMFINLVQYYQMETRWPIKRLLLNAFTAACNLDHVIVDILLTSVLPLEIVEDMKTNFSNLERFKQLVEMLTIVFCMGQQMPTNHQDFMGVHFASFLLEIVEGNNPDVLVDQVVALILAFNQQFDDFTTNVVLEALQNLQSVKVFTEKLLLLLNREDDPTNVLRHRKKSTNAVLKIFIDIFSLTSTATIFYSNDSKVLIDILVRQLSDLCAGSQMRASYLELCRRILRNTAYHEHQHRKQDLMKIFTRIFCEETECSSSDQQLVREIANEFPQLFKA